MEIKVIGNNSSNRIKLIKNIKKATDNNMDIKLIEKDNKYNITNTPALVINDKVISQGKVLNEREIKKFIEVLA
jgi:protein-disulfide isomerase